ncbi:hypothetical protein ACTJI8_14475 [Microbacterium sp. 22303]
MMDVLQIDACCHDDGFDRRGVRDRASGSASRGSTITRVKSRAIPCRTNS